MNNQYVSYSVNLDNFTQPILIKKHFTNQQEMDEYNEDMEIYGYELISEIEFEKYQKEHFLLEILNEH